MSTDVTLDYPLLKHTFLLLANNGKENMKISPRDTPHLRELARENWTQRSATSCFSRDGQQVSVSIQCSGIRNAMGVNAVEARRRPIYST